MLEMVKSQLSNQGVISAPMQSFKSLLRSIVSPCDTGGRVNNVSGWLLFSFFSCISGLEVHSNETEPCVVLEKALHASGPPSEYPRTS